MLTVTDGIVVSLDYTLRLDDGEIIDASEQEPLEFLHGYNQIIPGLERALTGMKVGESKEVIVAATDAYGEEDEDAYQLVERTLFPPEMELEEGMQLRMRDAQSGEAVDVVIAEVNESNVLLDFNHPLAGEELHFQVKVVGLRPATPEELAHGHTHGDNDHH
ncbi:MAG: peptidylprolyl isomerase [Chloroflexi bacterium]|nr:peptidylprolyl isomerase [Ardenticatenaceae bacterium]MBL1131386.1 peptidylprolyl isomerase [Chloroflexota bacterium]NOG37492.1 peptidylprolyl isomerase [Chloroflexota bacterium]GIK58268.1 MAG: peptidyl-prolyl cis-trans isomerase [Chloroflexota bacterium]